MDITYKGLITKTDFLKAYRIAIKERFGIRRWLFIAIFSMCFFTILIVVLASGYVNLDAALLLLVSFAMAILFIFLPRIWGRNYEKAGNDYRFPIHGSISDEGLTLVTINSEGKTKWDAFTKYAFTEDTLLLFRGKNQFNMLTRDLFLSDVDWDQLLDLVEEKI